MFMNDPRSYAVGTIALSRGSQGRLVAGAKPDKKPFKHLDYGEKEITNSVSLARMWVTRAPPKSQA